VLGAGKACDDQFRFNAAAAASAYVADCGNVAHGPHGHAPSAVFNRTANPIIRAVLSSPLHPVLSRGLALITVTGSRSGRRYTFPVGYRQDGDWVTVNVGWPRRKHWWRNLRQGARVEMRIRGQRRAGQAQAHGDERTGVTVDVQLDPGA
jgi:hypothetical protein